MSAPGGPARYLRAAGRGRLLITSTARRSSPRRARATSDPLVTSDLAPHQTRRRHDAHECLASSHYRIANRRLTRPYAPLTPTARHASPDLSTLDLTPSARPRAGMST